MNINLLSLSNNKKSSHICVKYGSEDVYTAGKSANCDSTPNWAQFISVAGQRLYTECGYTECRLTLIRSGRIPLFSNVNEFNNVEFNIAGVVKINNVVKFNLGVTSSWRRACGPINCFDDKSNLTLLKIYQK